MAGLALKRCISYSSGLMKRIEFIGNSIFIPFFLISVGMTVEIRILIEKPEALLIAGTLIAVSITGKWSAAFFTQLIFGYSSAQRQVIYGLSGAPAAATLAVIMVGHTYGIVVENLLNGAIILILASCIFASLVTESNYTKIVVAG